MKDNEKKIKELTDICFRYSEYAYKLYGEINKDHLDTFEKTALDTFKDVIDSCICNNKKYKDYLEHKYIQKDVQSISEYVKKWIDDTNNIFIETNLDDMYEEDDTPTLVITNKKDDEKNNPQNIMYYNIETKSFSNAPAEYSKIFEETFNKE